MARPACRHVRRHFRWIFSRARSQNFQLPYSRSSIKPLLVEKASIKVLRPILYALLLAQAPQHALTLHFRDETWLLHRRLEIASFPFELPECISRIKFGCLVNFVHRGRFAVHDASKVRIRSLTSNHSLCISKAFARQAGIRLL